MFDAFQTEQGVAQRLNLRGPPAQHNDLHAIIVADVDVQDGNHQLVMVMLKFSHLVGQFIGVMVIDQRQAAQDFSRIGVFGQPLLHQGIANQIAQGFGSCGVTALGDQPVKTIE